MNNLEYNQNNNIEEGSNTDPEPSVLDFLKGWILPWKYPRIEIPDDFPTDNERELSPSLYDSGIADGVLSSDVSLPPPPGGEHDATIENLKTEEIVQKQPPSPVEQFPHDELEQAEPQEIGSDQATVSQVNLEEDDLIQGSAQGFPWSSSAALLLALIAQNSFEPGPERSWLPGVIFYCLAFIALGIAIYRREWRIANLPVSKNRAEDSMVRVPELIAGFVFAVLTFLTSGGNKFTLINLTALCVATFLIMRAFWVPQTSMRHRISKASKWLQQKNWTILITPQSLLLAGAVLLVIFVRLYGLDTTPPEMNSDHAEKILDVYRVLDGQTMIFFPTNGGREAIQMYLVAGLNRLLGIDVDFFALKLASSIVGIFSLVFVYKLGELIANKRVALLAFTFTGIAYWTNVVSRMGLRLPFIFLFTAATMFFLLRGLKKGQNNDLLWAGLSLGISFYGYTADRILPILVALIFVLFLLHKDSSAKRQAALTGFIGLVLVALVLFTPLFRFMVDYPEAFLFRSLSRVASVEQPLPGPALQIFLKNLGKALVMFSWSNGEVWTLSIPFRPALDIVTGALFWTGTALLLVRAVIKRHWLDISLLLSIPILMLPSVLALAFPSENPNLYRAGGAAIPVFLLAALSLDGFMSTWQVRLAVRRGSLVAWSAATLLVSLSLFQNYDLVFHEYHDQYRLSSWNTSEMGEVMRSFSETTGTPDSAWVVGYPHWVDTRIVAMMAGRPLGDVNITIDQLASIRNKPGPKLFLVKPEDELAAVTLNNLFPLGSFTTYASKVPSKEFMIFQVPAAP